MYDADKRIIGILYSKSRVKANAWENVREITMDVFAGLEEIHFFEKNDIPGRGTKVRVGSLIIIRSDTRSRRIAKRVTESQIENQQLVLEFESKMDMHHFREFVERDYNQKISSVQPEDLEVIAPSFMTMTMTKQSLGALNWCLLSSAI